MKKLLVIASAILLLSGCALSSTYTVGSDGTVSGTSTFAVPKSSLRNVSTVAQWSQVLGNNNFPAPSASPTSSTDPSAICEAGENVELAQWTYTCTAVGDVSVLSAATSTNNSASLKFARNGKTLTIVQPPSGSSGDSENPFGLAGISLFFTTTTITFPGLVTSVSGGAEKIDDNTISFAADESQATEMSATLVMNELSSTPTRLDLTAKASPLAAGSADVEFTASLAAPAAGQVVFFDGDTRLGSVDVDEQGIAKFMAGGQSDGAHNYQAEFEPKDWWNVDTSQDQASLSFKTFQMANYPNISGPTKVGAILAVANLKPKPSAAKVSYQWLRNGKAIAGKTAKTYKVVAADFKKGISVRVTLRKTGYLPITFDTSELRISKR
ncbi:MAG: hypothetical protein NTW81_00595 [Actinobacteria bacterium]|nr:hypothetical protein [Actinomycetota bacterium]